MKERPMLFTHPGIGSDGPWVGWADPEKLEIGWDAWAARESESVALRAGADVRERDLAAARVVVKRRARLALGAGALILLALGGCARPPEGRIRPYMVTCPEDAVAVGQGNYDGPSGLWDRYECWARDDRRLGPR